MAARCSIYLASQWGLQPALSSLQLVSELASLKLLWISLCYTAIIFVTYCEKLMKLKIQCIKYKM